MKHVTMVESTPDGYLGRCESCHDRNDKFTGYGPALAWCDKHENRGSNAMHKGSGSLKALEKAYRERSANLVYSPEEREQWQVLADELAEENAARNVTVLPGQMALFGADPEGDTR